MLVSASRQDGRIEFLDKVIVSIYRSGQKNVELLSGCRKQIDSLDAGTKLIALSNSLLGCSGKAEGPNSFVFLLSQICSRHMNIGSQTEVFDQIRIIRATLNIPCRTAIDR